MFNITADRTNRDMLGRTVTSAFKHYSNLYSSTGRKSFTSKMNLPSLEDIDNRKVLRCDKVGGFKALAAERYIASLKEDVLVYCAPRTGQAPLAVARLAKLYNKHCVFFAPSSKVPTLDQVCVTAFGHDIRFVRIAAMPNLNLYAKNWAEQHGAKFLPFGLAKTPEITAGIVDLCQKLAKEHGTPKEVWCATSTGTMIRGLEIGFGTSTKYRTMAVARNMHSGEIGHVDIVSAEVPFLKKAVFQPPFPTTACYDAKAWVRCVKEGTEGSWFINVGSDQMVQDTCSDFRIMPDTFNSFREWGDKSDLERGV